VPRSLMQVVPVCAFAFLLVGCATGGSLDSLMEPSRDGTNFGTRPDEVPAAVAVASDEADSPALVAVEYRLAANEDIGTPVLVAQAAAMADAAQTDVIEDEYDPWEPFNERMFELNRRLDRYILKPVATGYNAVVPDQIQVMVANAFDNISFVPRMMNSLFQGKFDGAVREFSRFLFNSTVGIGGLFDVAKIEGIQKSREDFGQTLGFYGSPPGPYLVLPLMEPLTVRDGIGKGVDSFMDPLSYFVAFWPARFAMKAEEIVNDRSLNLELFQGFEESVVDMYSAVRHAYLKRREKMIRE
jgi:ABC-type transporter lipoprotein component MlaA